MAFTLDIPTGQTGAASLIVADEHTAAQVGSGQVDVLATPVMINLIEAAALAAIEHLLPAGYRSLGTQLDVNHVAATPVGMTVNAQAQVTGTEGRIIRFAVVARDEHEVIGSGVHERVVVNIARFEQQLQAKMHRPPE